jgi:hypothetical protein
MSRPEQLIRLGDDMSATANVAGFRSMEAGTLNQLMITVKEASLVDAVFNMAINDIPVWAGAARPKIIAGDVSVIKAGLSIDIAQFDIISIDLEAGDAKTPIEMGFKFAETGGVPDGGTTGQILAKASDDNDDTEWIDAPTGGGGTIAGKEVVIPDDFTGLNGYVPQYSAELDKFVLLAKAVNPANPGAAFPSSMPVFAVYEAFRETGLGNGDSVSTLTDLVSGSSRNATQATAGKKPIYTTNQLNGRAAYVFDLANSQEVTIPSMTGLSASEIWHVVKVNTVSGSSNTAIHQFGSDASSNHYPYTDGNNYDNGGSNARKSWAATGADSRVFHLGAWVNAAAEFTYYYNGTQKYTTGSNTPSLISTPTLAHAGVVYCSMALCATFIFTRKLTSDERDTMKEYVRNVYGLTIA